MSIALFDQLRQLDLPTGDYAVFGSAPLAVREIIPTCNDLDILCRGAVWETVCQAGTTEFLPDYNVTIASFYGDKVTFGTTWGIGEFDIDELIDTAEIIDSLPFVRIEHVIGYKTIRSSAKDLLHLKALEEFCSRD